MIGRLIRMAVGGAFGRGSRGAGRSVNGAMRGASMATRLMRGGGGAGIGGAGMLLGAARRAHRSFGKSKGKGRIRP